MHRFLLILCLASSFLFAQQEAQPVYDPDFEAELLLFNRFFQAGDAQGAYEHAQKLLEIATRKKMPPREVGAAEDTVGEALRKLQRYSEAEPHLRRSLALRESVLPKTHYRVLQSVDALANVLYQERKYDEAQPLMERTIAGYNSIPDRDGVDECHLGQALQNLGVIEETKRNTDKAEGLLVRASQSFLNVGLGCGQLHDVYWSLASVYWVENRRDKVEELYKAAVKIFTPEAGEDPDYHYGFYLSCLAGVYASEKRYDDADTLYKQALQAATHTASEHGPANSADLMAWVLSQYKLMLEETGRKAELAAVDQQLKAATAVNAAQSDSPGLQWQALTDQWRQADQEKRDAEAERDLRKALEVGRSMNAGDYRAVQSGTDLAWFVSRTRPDEGLQIMEQTYTAALHDVATDPLVLGHACDAMSAFYVQRKKPAAETTLKQCVTIWQKDTNQAHPWYRMSVEGLANYYIANNRYAEAEPLLLQSLGISERTLGPDNFQLASTVERLGYLYGLMGRWDKSEPYYRRQLALYQKQFGANNQMLNGVLHTLADVMRNLGRPKEADEFMARREQLGKAASITQK